MKMKMKNISLKIPLSPPIIKIIKEGLKRYKNN